MFAQAWHVKLKQRNVIKSTLIQILKYVNHQADNWQLCSPEFDKLKPQTAIKWCLFLLICNQYMWNFKLNLISEGFSLSDIIEHVIGTVLISNNVFKNWIQAYAGSIY